MRYLWDTNIAIYHIQANVDSDILDSIANTIQEGITISTITAIELLSWPLASDDNLISLRYFIDNVGNININNSIIDKTAEIRRKHKLKLGDAIIAASALVTKQTLVTRNIRDFSKVEGLELFDPFSKN